ncbi:33 kDa inner dynein arm light chain, axonemal [Hypsibius exemplaris]|uniref:33 kDa inner dynein arm light chain, axonemal n=1 Tax=Hypsibius exemplaris TaxID=2072580 RepID=A0A9X6NIT2_HYPEX|nr:33 kDa inner dynein arm light chain, axonemal [Hypsibius exemplaris]
MTMDASSILRSAAPVEHLVKHEKPQILSEKPNLSKPGMAKGKSVPLPEESDQLNYFLPVLPKLERREKNKTNVSSTESILDYILPPREWVGQGNQYIQKISRTPASRMDVINLQERLDARLEHLQARETGICPIRRDLYSQTFDSPDRGLMFLRIRDEIRMTMAAYETLFDRGLAYGNRNALTYEQEKQGSEDQITEVEEVNMELERQINEWKLKCQLLERKHTELRELDDKRHLEEIKAEKRPGIWLKNILDAIMNHTRADYFTNPEAKPVAPPASPTGDEPLKKPEDTEEPPQKSVPADAAPKEKKTLTAK